MSKKEIPTRSQQEIDQHSLKTTKIVTATAAIMLVFIIGYSVGAATDSTTDTATEQAAVEDGHSHDDSEGEGDSHSHEQYDVPEDEVVPEISNLTVEKDAKSGWNVSFETANFIFTPQNVNEDHVPGEGHAHIYVDGEKINRLYSNDYHLGELGEGEHEVEVVLNTNDHNEYVNDGEVVGATITAVDSHRGN